MFYLEHWGLGKAPFATDYAAAAFVPSQTSGLALAKLHYALGNRLGACALMGEPGVGKTQLVRMLLHEFKAANWLTAYLSPPNCSAFDILRQLEPSAVTDNPSREADWLRLEQLLHNRLADNTPVLLALDDVQSIRGLEFLDYLRNLLNIRANGKAALTLLLSGQPAMEKRLFYAGSLDQQLSVRVILEPLLTEEVKFYILSRLKAAGSQHGLFTRQAAERIVELSQGIPRQINRLCELAMVAAYGLGMKKIDPALIDQAAADLNIIPDSDLSWQDWSWDTSENLAAQKNEEEKIDLMEKPEEDILASLLDNQ